MSDFKVLAVTLQSGATSHTFTDNIINSNSVIDCYFTDGDIYYNTISQSGNSVTVSFNALNESVGCALVVNNLTDFSDIQTSLNGRLTIAEENITGMGQSIGQIGLELDNKQDALPEYENDKYLHVDNNGNLEWKTVQGGSGGTVNDSDVTITSSDFSYLSTQKDFNELMNTAFGVMYEEVDTLYNYVGDLDYLETTDKSDLVNAINEVNSKSGVSTLSGLSDTNITTPLDNQHLVFDSILNKWINKTIPFSPSGVNYSTVEQDSGLKWIDGKTIYQKSYRHNGAVSSGGTLLDTLSGFSELIDAKITASNSNKTLWMLPVSSNNSNTMRVQIENNGNVKLYTDTNWSDPKVNITIYYTKS